MAYRAFAAPDSLPVSFDDAPAAFAESADAPISTQFAPLELRVIGLAEADPIKSLGTPSRFAGWARRWFGFELPKPLADSRLEALRRFAVLARVTAGELPTDEISRFLEAGFSRLQARLLQRRAAFSAR